MTPATVAVIVAISSIGFAIVLAIAWWSALRRSRRLSKQLDEQRPFSDFIRNTDLAVILTDRERRITWTNDAFTEATGFALDEVRGEKPGKFLQCKETADSTIGELRHALDSGKGFAGELLNCDKMGRRYWVEIYIEPYFDANDQLAGFCSLQRDITDRKALEDALAESHALFNGALDAATVGIAILDVTGNVLFVNAEWRRTFGESDARGSRVSVGSNYFDNCSASIYDSVVNGIRRVQSGELPVFEMEYQDPQSRAAKWRSLRITKFGRQGSVRLMVTIEDISERKAAEERLFYKKEKLRSVYNACSDGILLFNSTGLFDGNKSAIAMFGAGSIDQLMHRQLADLTAFDESNRQSIVAEISNHLARALKTGDTQFECLLRDVNGRIFPGDVQLSTFQHFEERIVQVTIRDTTERKENERRLNEMNQVLRQDLEARIAAEQQIRRTTLYLDVYRNIVDHHAIVSETDVRGNLIAVNDAFCQLSGYTREELLGRNHRILSSGIHPPEMWREMFLCTLKNGYWHGEICNRNKKGELFWVDTTIAPLFNESGELRGYFAIRADITSLKIAQAQAESASRSKSEFLANMSHEIRTPMTAILGYTDILQEMERCSHCQSTQQTKVAVETIQRNGEHLLAIINDILDISKIEADKMTTELLQVSLPAIVTDLLDTMQVKAQAKGLALEYEALSPLPVYISTDPTRLRQILVNLLGNAIKFTEVGSVRVSLRVDELDSRRLLVQVDDTGIGMTDEQMGRLFNAFEQADSSTTRRFGGTGLGLRISKRLAEMLGGEIGVARNALGGSTFTLAINIGESNDGRLLEPAAFVPAVSMSGFARVASNTVSEGPGAQVDVTLAPQTLRAIEAASSAAPAVRPLEGANILVAEDGPDNQRLILHHLRKAGATVQLVQNGKHTVETLTQNGDVESALKADHGFHLILMDMQMPTMDGYKATRILRSKGLTIPIIALTAHAMDGDLQRCLEAGCDLRLTKPIDRPKLIETCRSIYVGGATAGANVLQLEAQLCPTVAFQNPVAV